MGAEEGLHDPSLWSLASTGERWLIDSNSGVSHWRDGRLQVLVPARELPHPAVYSLLVDRSGSVWVGLRAGLARFGGAGGRRQDYPALDGVQVNGAVPAPDGCVRLATAAGLMLADGATASAVGADSELMLVAERIRTGITDCPTAPGQPPCVTASLGVAAWPITAATERRHNWTVALDLAGFAMYRAKDAGRNRIATLDLARLAPDDWPDRPDAACLQAWLDAGTIGLALLPEATGQGSAG